MRLATLDQIGHNNPPGPIDFAKEAMEDLSRFLENNPVIQSEEQAREGGLFVERTRKTIQDLEDARKKEVGPLNEEVKRINEQYRSVRDPMDGVLSDLRRRLTDFTAKEEAKRFREAELARQKALELEMEARRAEEAEREAKQNSTLGEVTNVAAAIIEADQTFSAFKQADRTASIAEKHTAVRIPSQLGGKALSLRTRETLILDDAIAAIQAIGVTEAISDAILSAARNYRKLKGELPNGVRSETKRSI
jgi:hypothetical protein